MDSTQQWTLQYVLWQLYKEQQITEHSSLEGNETYSTIASRSAMSPSTMRWMMLLCSSSDKFLWETRGVLYLVAGEGSTPCSQVWLSISSSEARRLGSLCSMRSIRLGWDGEQVEKRRTWYTKGQKRKRCHLTSHIVSRSYPSKNTLCEKGLILHNLFILVFWVLLEVLSLEEIISICCSTQSLDPTFRTSDTVRGFYWRNIYL